MTACLKTSQGCHSTDKALVKERMLNAFERLHIISIFIIVLKYMLSCLCHLLYSYQLGE